MNVYTPENIEEMPPNYVFVFGSNLAGKHDAGGAKTALEKFGAIYGKGSGFQGRSYAIPTLNENLEKLPLEQIEKYIETFKLEAVANIDKLFLVTKIGCGIAGFSPEQIAPFFFDIGQNIILPKEFADYVV